MAKGAVLDQYKQHQQQMSAKHLNKQWDHQPHLPKNKGVPTSYQDVLDKKWDTAKKKLKPPVDMEAILALEEKLWNS